jgi:hypothetical protein
MRRGTRRGFFFVSFLIFIVLSWLTVFYALGYKYDFVQNKFLKTGSFEISVSTDAQIYINDELAGTTSFLGKSFSKSRLLPRTFVVRVQNEKYQPWQKLVDIEAGVFSDFPRVVLIPQDPAEDTIASSSLKGVTSIQFDAKQGAVAVSNGLQVETISLDNGQRVSLQPFIKSTPKPTPSLAANLLGATLPAQTGLPAANNETNLIQSPDGNKGVWFNNREVWVKWLKDTDYQPARIAGDTELVARFPQKIADVQWYKDSDHLIASVGGLLEFIEIDSRGSVNISAISIIDSPFYYDKGANVIFRFVENKLTRINLNKPQL